MTLLHLLYVYLASYTLLACLPKDSFFITSLSLLHPLHPFKKFCILCVFPLCAPFLLPLYFLLGENE